MKTLENLTRAAQKISNAMVDTGSTSSALAHDFEMMAVMARDAERRIIQLEAIETGVPPGTAEMYMDPATGGIQPRIEYPDPDRFGEFITVGEQGPEVFQGLDQVINTIPPAGCDYCGGRYHRVNKRGGKECSGCSAPL